MFEINTTWRANQDSLEFYGNDTPLSTPKTHLLSPSLAPLEQYGFPEPLASHHKDLLIDNNRPDLTFIQFEFQRNFVSPLIKLPFPTPETALPTTLW